LSGRPVTGRAAAALWNYGARVVSALNLDTDRERIVF
jgi:hypothetical protein